jgi:hypothetical protein
MFYSTTSAICQGAIFREKQHLVLAALFFGFVLLAALLIVRSTLFRLFFRLLLGCWLHDGGRVIGFLLGKTGGGGRVMYCVTCSTISQYGR